MKISKANKRALNELVQDILVCSHLVGKFSQNNPTEHRHWVQELRDAQANLSKFLEQ